MKIVTPQGISDVPIGLTPAEAIDALTKSLRDTSNAKSQRGVADAQARMFDLQNNNSSILREIADSLKPKEVPTSDPVNDIIRKKHQEDYAKIYEVTTKFIDFDDPKYSRDDAIGKKRAYFDLIEPYYVNATGGRIMFDDNNKSAYLKLDKSIRSMFTDPREAADVISKLTPTWANWFINKATSSNNGGN